METYLNQYLRHCKVIEWQAKKTLENKRYSINIFLSQENISNINDISCLTLTNFFERWLDVRFWSQNTYLNYFKYLKWFTTFLFSKDLISKNPFDWFKNPKKPKTLPKRLTEDQARKILYSAYSYNWTYQFEKERNHAMIATLLFTGLRLSELLNLEYHDINLKDWTLYIREWKWWKDRVVPIHSKLKNTLLRYDKDKQRLNKKSIKYFCSVRSDKWLTKKNFYSIVKKIKGDSWVIFTPHQLRHTFASCALDNWLDIYSVKECLWHWNISTTQIYLSMSTKTLQEKVTSIQLYS